MSSTFKFIGFLTVGFLGTFVLLIASEYFGITKFEISFFGGGRLWAFWLYLIYFLIAFLFSSFVFRLSKWFYVGSIVATIILFVVLYYLTNGTLFENPRPFGSERYY